MLATEATAPRSTPAPAQARCAAAAYLLDAIPSTSTTPSAPASDGGGTDPTPSPTAPAPAVSPACVTASNYANVTADRPDASGGYAYAKGFNQRMSLDNTFHTSVLERTGPDQQGGRLLTSTGVNKGPQHNARR